MIYAAKILLIIASVIFLALTCGLTSALIQQQKEGKPLEQLTLSGLLALAILTVSTAFAAGAL